MAIDQPQDVLHGVVHDLRKELSDAFTRAHPAFDAIRKNGIEKLGSHEYAWDVAVGSPETAIKIGTGNESITSSRKPVSRQATERPARVVLTYEVPCRELARANGKNDIVKIFDKYPKLAMNGGIERWARQFFRGASSAGNDPSGDTGMNGFVTLNPDQSYTPESTARTGILSYTGRSASPDSGSGQTGTRFGLACEDAATDPAEGWYSQYGNITSFSTDGRRTINTVLQRANYQQMLEGAKVDILACDEATFQNIVEDMEGLVWLSDLGSPSTTAQSRAGIKYGMGGGIPLYHEPEIDIGDTTSYTTAAARLGVLVGLSLKTWHLFVAAGNSALATGGFFDAVKPILLQDRDAYQYRLVADLNFACDSLRHQLCVTGGSVA